MKGTFLECLLVLMSLLLIIGAGCLSCINKEIIRNNVYLDRTPQHVYSKSVVMIYVNPPLSFQKAYLGTAFAVNKDYLFTAGHVCSGIEARQKTGEATEIIYLTPSNNKGFLSPMDTKHATIVHYVDNKDSDICFIRSRDHGFPFIQLSTRYNLVMSGDKVIIIGYPAGYTHVVEDGRVVSVTDEVLFLNTFVERGNSGSPVLWGNEVIGMAIAYNDRKDKRMRNLSYAEPVTKLQEFLKLYGE